MSTIYPEIKSILDKCGVSADHVASITIKPMSVTIKRYALKDGKPYSEDNNVAMEPDLVIAICTQEYQTGGLVRFPFNIMGIKHERAVTPDGTQESTCDIHENDMKQLIENVNMQIAERYKRETIGIRLKGGERNGNAKDNGGKVSRE